MQQMYLQLALRQSESDSFNRHLAGMLGGFKGPPGGAQDIMNSVGAPSRLDPGAMMQNLMQLQQYHQQQLGALDAAKTLGITPNEALAMPQDSIRTAMAMGIQPEQLRTYNAYANQYAQEHQKEIDPSTGQPIGLEGARKLFEQQNPMSLSMAGATGGAGADPQRLQMQADLADFQRTYPGKTAPFNDVNSWQQWKLKTGQQTADRARAMPLFGDLDAGLTSYTNTLGSIAANPDLPNLVGNKLNEGYQYLPSAAANAAYGSLNPLHTQIKSLQDQAGVLASKGGPGTQASLLGLNSDAANLTKYSLPDENYSKDVITPVMKQALTAQANNYGATGQTDSMPGYLKPYLSDVYKPGGELYVSSGAKRATGAPKPGSRPLGPKDMKDFQTYMERYGPQRALQQFGDEGFDTSSVE